MSIIDDFEDINRRVNRKPETELSLDGPDWAPVNRREIAELGRAEAQAAIRTLKALGYTYTEGAEQWKPPLGKAPDYVSIKRSAKAQAAYNAMFQSIDAIRPYSFRALRDDEAALLIEQYDREARGCYGVPPGSK